MSGTYDYIVIGGGSAGCVMARRLTEDPARTVLLLEAGMSDRTSELQEAIQVPSHFQFMQKSAADWDYETEPQPHLNNRRIYTPRGRILGGTSTFIAGLVVRGNRRNFDEWAEQAQDDSWRYENVLPLFRRMENNTRPGIGPLHGTQGPMTVVDIEMHPATQAFFAAAGEQGYDRTDDFNDYEQVGGGSPYQMYLKDGREVRVRGDSRLPYPVYRKDAIRVNSANSYLSDDVRARPNLTIALEAEATRIVFDGRRATAVEYMQRGTERRTASAGREIVLCGGSINSPKLLLQSGVGPADHLAECGIPLVHDLPGVGRNYHDQPIAGVVYSYRKGQQPHPSTAAGIEGGLFVRTRPELAAPNLQMVFNSGVVGPPRTLPDWNLFALVGALVRPRSRGELRLRPGDPNGKPLIDPNFLSYTDEMDVLVNHVRTARQIIASHRFDDLRGDEIQPGPDVRTEDQIADYIRNTAITLFHPVGTCRMGAGPQDGSVVDSRLRVFGVQGLRVVDASIMPMVTAGNTHTPTTMIGEKGAEMIRNETATSVYRRSYYAVQPEAVNRMRSAIETYTNYVRLNEPETRRYLVVQSVADPTRFTHIAEFSSQAAFGRSQNSTAYREFVETLRPVLSGDVAVEEQNGQLVAGGGSQFLTSTDFVILVEFRVKNSSGVKRFREIIAEDLDAFRTRGEPHGLLQFEAFQDPENDRRYFYSQRWVSPEAQRRATETYVNFEETQQLTVPRVMAPFGAS